ncbi:uncharacterized protein [Dysidea avara]|uniref:uncharacterized protein n=1 Tax=Dysidea avara TaxID=196820 RepID=UPI00332AAE2C
MLLPCRHIIGTRLHKGLSVVDLSMINQRWLKSYQIDFVTESTHHDDPACTSNCALEYDLLPEPPMQKTLNQAQKYKKMLNLCQKIAAQASMVGMPQFREMYNTVEMLVKNWDSGSKCIVVSCDDECEKCTSDHEESTLDGQVASDEAVKECSWETIEYEVECDIDDETTQYSDTTWHVDFTQHTDVTQHGDITSHDDVTQHGDTTSHDDVTQYDDTTRHSDVTQHGDVTQYGDTTGHGDTTRHSDVTQHGDTTRHGDVTQHGDTTRHGDVTKHGDTTGHCDVTQHGDTTRHCDVTQHGDTTRHGDVTQHSDTTRHGDVTQYGDTTGHSDVTQHSDTTRHGEVTQHSDTTRHGDVTQQSDTTRHDDTAQLEKQIMKPAKRATMQQNTILHSSIEEIIDGNGAGKQTQLKNLAVTSIKKSSIHLKPSIKARGRPKYSSKLWPSKSKKRQHSEDWCKENIQPSVQVGKTSNNTQRKRSRRCGECIGCTSVDCQKCSACQDMVKYGGPGKKKQCCVNRRCVVTEQHKCSYNSGTSHTWVDLCKPEWWTLKPEVSKVVLDIWQEASQGIFGKMGSSDMMDIDVYALFPGNWLTDKGITTFLKVAAKRCLQMKGLNTFVASTFLYNSMCRNMNLAKRWYRDVNICDYELRVIPVNINESHWILVVLQTTKKELWLFDSTANVYVSCISVFKEWLVLKTATTWRDINAASVISNMPLQSNSSDCGVFVCLYALHEMMGERSYQFSQGNTHRIREWITWKITETCLKENL